MIVAAASSTPFNNAVVRALLPIRRWKANLTFSGSLLSLARSLRSSVMSSSSENVSGSRGRRSGRVGDGIGDCFRVHLLGYRRLGRNRCTRGFDAKLGHLSHGHHRSSVLLKAPHGFFFRGHACMSVQLIFRGGRGGRGRERCLLRFRLAGRCCLFCNASNTLSIRENLRSDMCIPSMTTPPRIRSPSCAPPSATYLSNGFLSCWLPAQI